MIIKGESNIRELFSGQKRFGDCQEKDKYDGSGLDIITVYGDIIEVFTWQKKLGDSQEEDRADMMDSA